MSGIKCSSYEFQKILIELINSQRNSLILTEQFKSLFSQLNIEVEKIPHGIKETFSDNFINIENWIRKTKIFINNPFQEIEPRNIDKFQLNNYIQNQQRIISQCHDFLFLVQYSIKEKSKGLASIYDSELNKIINKLVENKLLFSKWFADNEIISIEKNIHNLRILINKQDLKEVDSSLEKLKNKVNNLEKEMCLLEDQNHKRILLLKALRQVCINMGFKEKLEPLLENTLDNRSRIIYAVDTLNRGDILFYLALDNIETYSGIQNQYCFEEFENLSEKLEENYGIRTEFQSKSNQQPKKLIESESKREPIRPGYKMEKKQ